MRLWSLHPGYLDARGLVALWREALLARAVLLGKTRGYRSHPQLDRFRETADPRMAIEAYLYFVQIEATARGYCFKALKLRKPRHMPTLSVSRGQLAYEWGHLLDKLKRRDPSRYDSLVRIDPEKLRPNGIFAVKKGGVEGWERV